MRAAAAQALERHGARHGRVAAGGRRHGGAPLAGARAGRASRAPRRRCCSTRATRRTPAWCRRWSGQGDVVFSDALNHASLVDGCRLSRAQRRRLPAPRRGGARGAAGGDARAAAAGGDRRDLLDGRRSRAAAGALRRCARATARRCWSTRRTRRACWATRAAGSAHALGVRPDVLVGTLSKALGAAGAYVAASPAVTQLLPTRARPLVFSTALPAAVCAGALAALERARTDAGAARAAVAEHRGLRGRAARRWGCRRTGTRPSSRSCWARRRRRWRRRRRCARAGILVKAIRPPTVPEGTSRLRFALSAAHSLEHVHQALAALTTVHPSVPRCGLPVHPSGVEGPPSARPFIPSGVEGPRRSSRSP